MPWQSLWNILLLPVMKSGSSESQDSDSFRKTLDLRGVFSSFPLAEVSQPIFALKWTDSTVVTVGDRPGPDCPKMEVFWHRGQPLTALTERWEDVWVKVLICNTILKH